MTPEGRRAESGAPGAFRCGAVAVIGTMVPVDVRNNALLMVRFLANLAHHADVGGRTPGSESGDNTSIFQDGLRLPPMKLADAGRVRQDVVDLVVRRRRDLREDRRRVVVARLDALEVQDREPTELRECPGEGRIDDRVHRRGEDRDRELEPAERLRKVDVGRLDRLGAGSQRDVLEAVGRTDGIELRAERRQLRRRRGAVLLDQPCRPPAPAADAEVSRASR